MSYYYYHIIIEGPTLTHLIILLLFFPVEIPKTEKINDFEGNLEFSFAPVFILSKRASSRKFFPRGRTVFLTTHVTTTIDIKQPKLFDKNRHHTHNPRQFANK